MNLTKQEIIDKYDDLGKAVLEYFIDEQDAYEALEDNYCGEYDSEEDYAMELLKECDNIPDYLNIYIDYPKFTRDLFINDNFSIKLNGKYHIFTTF
jgi:antirestriction protein